MSNKMSSNQVHVSGGDTINTLFASLAIIVFLALLSYRLIETKTLNDNKRKIIQYISAEAKANTKIEKFYLKKLSNSDNNFWKNALVVPSASLDGLVVSSAIHVFQPSDVNNEELNEYVFKEHISTLSEINTDNLTPVRKSVSIKDVFTKKIEHQKLRSEMHKRQSFINLQHSDLAKDKKIREIHKNTLKLIEILGFKNKRGISELISMT